MRIDSLDAAGHPRSESAGMIERYNRPALVAAIEGDSARGSGRSISGFDLHAGLSACDSLLTRFGGQIDPKVAETLSSRIHACWINPGAQPQAAVAATPAAPTTAGNAAAAPAASPSPAPSASPAPVK